MAEEKGSSISLHAHGDGSYHTMSPAVSEGYGGYGMGSGGAKTPGRKEHPSIGHALMHIAREHGSEGDHMHIHGDAEGYTTHHVSAGGAIKGPDEHKNMAQLKAHVADAMEPED